MAVAECCLLALGSVRDLHTDPISYFLISYFLFTNTSAAAQAVVAATTRIPIVVSPASEEVMASLATNFARPSGNVTGTTVTSRDQSIKCLQLLKEAAPRIRRVAMLVNPDNPSWRNYPAGLEPEIGRLGLELIRIDARGPVELDAALARAAALDVSALFGTNDSTLAGLPAARAIILAWCLQRRLPSGSTNAGFARDGGLIGFGTNIPALTRRGADFIHRILRGAKPADLPVERPTRFDMVVNLATARAIGLTLPATVLQRADEVIE